jgi:hypothetical protein
MSAHISFPYFDNAGFVTADQLAELGPPIEGKNDAVERVMAHFDRAVKAGHLDGELKMMGVQPGSRMDAKIQDAAEAFYTTNLEVVMSPIQRLPVSNLLMVNAPGSAQLLGVQSTLGPGQTAIVYDVESPTGQASWVDPEGVRKLTQVGEFSERKKHETAWCGIGWGWGLIESWRAAAMGRSLNTSRQATARNYLDRFCERVLLYGDVGHKLHGLLTHPACLQATLGTSFATITDPDVALVQLQILDLYFRRMTQTYGGQITGVIAPRTDLYGLQRLRYDGGEGQQALPFFLELFPWLRQVQWIDGIETASVDSGPVWIAWSDDASELWSEMEPTPMVFGPWSDQMRTSFAYLRHIGGVICRRHERIARFKFAA